MSNHRLRQNFDCDCMGLRILTDGKVLLWSKSGRQQLMLLQEFLQSCKTIRLALAGGPIGGDGLGCLQVLQKAGDFQIAKIKSVAFIKSHREPEAVSWIQYLGIGHRGEIDEAVVGIKSAQVFNTFANFLDVKKLSRRNRKLGSKLLRRKGLVALQSNLIEPVQRTWVDSHIYVDNHLSRSLANHCDLGLAHLRSKVASLLQRISNEFAKFGWRIALMAAAFDLLDNLFIVRNRELSEVD